MLAPILQEVKSIVKDEVRIIKINVDQHQDLAAEFMVRGVPTMLLFNEGKMLWRQSGVLSAKDLVTIIRQHSK
jgi:thioredoxin 1